MSIIQALEEFEASCEPAVCAETLDEFFECWLTHERTDSDDFKMRATRYQAYTSLRTLLTSLEQGE